LKLNKRLKKIDQMVTSPYEHIWDCCCDHGLLGASLLSRQAAPTIHFIDIVPELIEELEHKLQRFYSDSLAAWTAQCIDVKKLSLAQYDGKHLIIIAGIGGDLMTELVESIYQNNSTADIDFLLCPVHHQFTLRQKLIALAFSLKDEVLIEENKRFYEILLVSSKEDKSAKITSTGEKIWQYDSVEQSAIVKKYLTKTLNHYQRIKLGSKANNTDNVQDIISAYQAHRVD
jgi:tRNA (adenine22-N1)-methyltransferase